MREAADSARTDYDMSSAVVWGDGCEFPPQFVSDDAACLNAAGGNFEAMVRTRLEHLSPDRLSASRVEGLRADNPERPLMFDLVIGMKAFVPEGFVANGLSERSPLRKKYDCGEQNVR